MNRLIRRHFTCKGRHIHCKRTKQLEDGLNEWKRTVLRSLSSGAVVHDSTFEVTDANHHPPILPTIDFNTTKAERWRILRHLSLHPLYNWQGSVPEWWSPEIGRDSQFITQLSRQALRKILLQSRVSGFSSDFVHVDLLLKRQSKMQLTVLIDMAYQGNKNMSGFYLAPVDSSVTHSYLSKALGFSRSLRFIDLPHRLMLSDEVEVNCVKCDSKHIFSKSDCVGANVICTTAGCTDDVQPNLGSSLHPGGNRHYWGPTVPDLRNVWIGHVDQIAHKNDGVGIITASVFRLFRDPANTTRKITLPGPDPRVQWAIVPIIDDKS